MIIDDTKYYDRHEYDIAVEEYIKNVTESDDILSIYSFGDIGAPGLSDIDLIVVLKNKIFPCRADKKYSPLNIIDERSKYLFVHNPTYLNEKLFKNINYLYPFFKIEKIWGKTINIEIVDKESTRDLITAHLLHMFIIKVPIDYIKFIYNEKKYGCRIIIVLINSLKHTYNLYLNIGGKQINNVFNYFKEFSILRHNWFELDREKRKYELEHFIKQFERMLKEFILGIADLLNEIYGPINLERLNFVTDLFVYEYSSQKKFSIDINKKLTIIFPNIFALTILYAAKMKNKIGKYVLNCFDINSSEFNNYLVEHNDVFEKYIRYKQEYTIFAQNKLLRRAAVIEGWGYRTRIFSFLLKVYEKMGMKTKYH